MERPKLIASRSKLRWQIFVIKQLHTSSVFGEDRKQGGEKGGEKVSGFGFKLVFWKEKKNPKLTSNQTWTLMDSPNAKFSQCTGFGTKIKDYLQNSSN